MLQENVSYQKLLKSKIDALVKDGLMTRKEAEEMYGPIDMNSEEGRADMENWIFNGLSNYVPFSFFTHSGNWTGTFTTLAKDGRPIKEWNAIRDETSVNSFKKPYADLTDKQKKIIQNKMAKNNLPGKVTKKKHKGNLLYKDVDELKEAEQRAQEREVEKGQKIRNITQEAATFLANYLQMLLDHGEDEAKSMMSRAFANLSSSAKKDVANYLMSQ